MGEFLSIALRLRGQRCIIAGGGRVALHKAKKLLEAGADITAVSPRFIKGFDALAELQRVRRKFESDDLKGMFLGVAATADRNANRAFAVACRARGVLCNVVDDPELSDFIFPATASRGPLQVAVCTSGAAPALSKRLAAELDAWLDPMCGEYVIFLASARKLGRQRLRDAGARREFAAALASREGFDRYRALTPEEREQWLSATLSAHDRESKA